jgi:hypothetical protein
MSNCQVMSQQKLPTTFSSSQSPISPPDGSDASSRVPTPLTVVMQDVKSAKETPAISVSSLRALALSTMRTKRKRGEAAGGTQLAHTLPPRPMSIVNTNTVTLDYGSDVQDNNATPVTTPTTVELTPVDKPVQMSGESREEGEISDEEDMPISPLVTPHTRERSNTVASGTMPQPPPDSSTSSFMSLGSDAQQPSLVRFSGQLPTTTFSASPDSNTWSSWVPSPDHVRPGLKSKHHSIS